MTTGQELIPVKLANGAKIRVAATVLGGEEDVAFKLLSFEEVTKTIEGVADSLQTALQKVKPKKASVEFGLEIGVESGAVTALLVKAYDHLTGLFQYPIEHSTRKLTERVIQRRNLSVIMACLTPRERTSE